MLSGAKRGAVPRVLLTGRPGCGKTTVVRRVVERVGAERCGGFYTEEVREGGRRIGFDVVPLGGRRVPLARLGAAGPRVGRYGVELERFEDSALSALEAATTGSGRIIILDEIGKMELLSQRFRSVVASLMSRDATQPVLGTILSSRHPAVEPLRHRPDIQIIAVTLSNRDGLPDRLSDLYRRILDT